MHPHPEFVSHNLPSPVASFFYFLWFLKMNHLLWVIDILVSRTWVLKSDLFSKSQESVFGNNRVWAVKKAVFLSKDIYLLVRLSNDFIIDQIWEKSNFPRILLKLNFLTKFLFFRNSFWRNSALSILLTLWLVVRK